MDHYSKSKEKWAVDDPIPDASESKCEFFDVIRNKEREEEREVEQQEENPSTIEEDDFFQEIDFENQESDSTNNQPSSTATDSDDDFEIEAIDEEIVEEIDLGDYMFTICLTENDPETIEDALNSSEGEGWKTAILEEFDSLKKMGTWVKVKRTDIPKGVKIIK